MSRATIILHGNADRQRATKWIAQAPWGTRVTFKATKRTLDQNSRMWAMLTDVATQLAWHGLKLRADDWKLIFMDALRREKRSLRIVPNIDGTGFVNLGNSTSDLSKDEMSELMELIAAFGANHGVVFHDPTSPREPSPSLAPDHRERESEREPA